MKRTTIPMFRYGEADFDRDYMTWGFHDRPTQVEEAESVLGLIGDAKPLRILDLACGIGTHAIHWARQGHHVTAVDLSETFLNQARKMASEEGVEVVFAVGDILHLPYRRDFDVVTWVEKSFFDDEIVRAVRDYLDDSGVFIFDARNPEHPRMKQRTSDWRTWREENGIFYLESHETDEGAGVRRSVWIEIDTLNDTITEKPEVQRIQTEDAISMLLANGFSSAEYRAMDGQAFTGGQEPYWLWAVARK